MLLPVLRFRQMRILETIYGKSVPIRTSLECMRFRTLVLQMVVFWYAQVTKNRG